MSYISSECQTSTQIHLSLKILQRTANSASPKSSAPPSPLCLLSQPSCLSAQKSRGPLGLLLAFAQVPKLSSQKSQIPLPPLSLPSLHLPLEFPRQTLNWCPCLTSNLFWAGLVYTVARVTLPKFCDVTLLMKILQWPAGLQSKVRSFAIHLVYLLSPVVLTLWPSHSLVQPEGSTSLALSSWGFSMPSSLWTCLIKPLTERITTSYANCNHPGHNLPYHFMPLHSIAFIYLQPQPLSVKCPSLVHISVNTIAIEVLTN